MGPRWLAIRVVVATSVGPFGILLGVHEQGMLFSRLDTKGSCNRARVVRYYTPNMNRFVKVTRIVQAHIQLLQMQREHASCGLHAQCKSDPLSLSVIALYRRSIMQLSNPSRGAHPARWSSAHHATSPVELISATKSRDRGSGQLDNLAKSCTVLCYAASIELLRKARCVRCLLGQATLFIHSARHQLIEDHPQHQSDEAIRRCCSSVTHR